MNSVHALTKLLRLLHLASPALPIGAFHFSQGLEYAVERHWVRDEQDACDWIAGVAETVVSRLDLPVLKRMMRSFEDDDLSAVRRWNAYLLASRETSELRAEDEHMGAALVRVMSEHEVDFSTACIERPTFAAAFAFACHAGGVGVHETMTTYSWAWLENQVMAAIKLVPLGQSAGQRILHVVGRDIPRLVEFSDSIQDDDIGVAAVMHSVASARHETQYTRLFRS